MTEQDKNPRRPFQTAGERLDDLLGDASRRIEDETQLLIKYINDELVPAIRQHSTSALRVAAEKLAQAADHMDSRQTEKALTSRPPLLACVAAVLLLLAGCGGHKTARRHPVPPPPTIAPPPTAPAETATTTKPPAPQPNAKPIYVETGLASWYGPPYHHRRGANGEIYDENAMTAAHRTLPLNSMVRVTNLTTGRTAMVRITDRGPFIEDRIVDLSLAAAKAVDVWRPGTAEVRLEVLSAPASILQGGRWCVQIGAFHSESEARKLKEKLQDRYENANVIQFTGPTGEWVRIRPEGDDKSKAEEVASKTHVKEGGVFLVRLD